MLVYMFICITIIILGVSYELINLGAKDSLTIKKVPKLYFVLPSFLLLWFVSSFRGAFTTDYDHYVSLFKLYNKYDFSDLFSYDFTQESGYIALSRFVGSFTDNELYLFLVVSFIILYGFFSQFSKHSPYVWLSVLLFVTIGAYYTSFNVMRQILAVSIVFLGSKFLYDRNFFKYCLVVLLASLFHTTALIMIVFYFILNIKFTFKKFILYSIVLVLSLLYLEPIITLVRNYVYSEYIVSTFGMGSISYKNAIVPVSILIFSLFFYKKIDLSNNKYRIWLNAVVFYAFFNILSVEIQLIQRISEFFAPYVCLFIPLIFYKLKSNELKIVIMMGFVSILVLYNYYFLSQSGYNPYYFIFD